MAANVILGAAAGAVGGLLGSWAMVRFNHLLGGIEARPAAPFRSYRPQATPNDTDGTISDEPASIQVAARVGERVMGRPLERRERRVAGPFFHYLFGAMNAAIYGGLAERRREFSAGFGVPFGAMVWLGAAEAGLPLAGLAAPPQHYPASRHLSSLGTHLVFGVTVEAVRRSLRGRPASGRGERQGSSAG